MTSDRAENTPSGRPLDQVIEALHARATERARSRLQCLAELRAVMDAYEEWVRTDAELEIVAEVAPRLALDPPERPSGEDVRRRLVAALSASLAALDAAALSEARGPGAPEAADGPVEPPVPIRTTLDPSAVDEPPRSRPIAPADVAQFFEKLRGQAAPTPPKRQSHDERPLLRRLLSAAGPPPTIGDPTAALAELATLDELTRDEATASWHALSSETVTLWLSMLVARGRELRDRTVHGSAEQRRLREILARLPTYASRRETGFINGMTPRHGPARGSWHADAAHAFDALATRAAMISSDEKSDNAAPRAKRKKTPEERVEEQAPASTWALRDVVRSMRILMFGGTPREEARANLERALEAAELEWATSARPREVQSVVERIGAGRYDAVLTNRLVTHAELHKIVAAAKDAGTPFAMIETGYGLEAVKHALERALGHHAEP